MSEKQEPNDGLDVAMVAIIGIVSSIVVIALIFGIQVLYYNVANAEINRKVTQQPDPEADSAVAQQEAKLARYGWIDKSEGEVAIPIERAMELIVRESQTERPGEGRK